MNFKKIMNYLIFSSKKPKISPDYPFGLGVMVSLLLTLGVALIFGLGVMVSLFNNVDEPALFKMVEVVVLGVTELFFVQPTINAVTIRAARAILDGDFMMFF